MGIVNKTQARKAFEKQRVSPEFFDKLEEKVQQLIEDAGKHARENRRKTVMGRDL